MVALLKADIPNDIDTVEKLAVWCSALLSQLHPSTTVVEATSVAERVSTSSPYFIVATTPNVWRHIGRNSIELQPNWQSNGKIWQNAKPLSSAAIPADFKA